MQSKKQNQNLFKRLTLPAFIGILLLSVSCTNYVKDHCDVYFEVPPDTTPAVAVSTNHSDTMGGHTIWKRNELHSDDSLYIWVRYKAGEGAFYNKLGGRRCDYIVLRLKGYYLYNLDDCFELEMKYSLTRGSDYGVNTFSESCTLTDEQADTFVLFELEEGPDFTLDEWDSRTCYKIIAEFDSYKNGEEKVSVCNDYDEKHIEVYPPVFGPGTYSIQKYCGDQRYGGGGDTLDYPLAYPITVLTFNDKGIRSDNIGVEFTVESGDARFVNSTCGSIWDTCFVMSGSVDIGPDSLGEFQDTLQKGAAKCPIYFPFVSTSGWNSEIKARITTDTVNDEVVFDVRCTGDENESCTDAYNVHERIPKLTGSVITGDGLWGDCASGGGSQSVDNDLNHKNLWLEIDYLSDSLGPSWNIKLSEADMEYIYANVSDYFLNVDIVFDPNPMIDPTYALSKQPGSVIQEMNDEWTWKNDTLNFGEPYRNMIMCGDQYKTVPPASPPEYVLAKNEIRKILHGTRGAFGDEYLVTGSYLGKWERVRVHVVLLPGWTKVPTSVGDSTEPYGWAYSDLQAQNFNSRHPRDASGTAPNMFNPSNTVEAFPWTDGTDMPETEETWIDNAGILIFTGKLPPLDSIHSTWKCNQYIPGTSNPYNEYNDVLVHVIAHEIGHALGLGDEPITSTNQLMCGEVDFKDKKPDPIWITSIDKKNKAVDKFINLRKVLGREMTTARW